MTRARASGISSLCHELGAGSTCHSPVALSKVSIILYQLRICYETPKSRWHEICLLDIFLVSPLVFVLRTRTPLPARCTSSFDRVALRFHRRTFAGELTNHAPVNFALFRFGAIPRPEQRRAYLFSPNLVVRTNRLLRFFSSELWVWIRRSLRCGHF